MRTLFVLLFFGLLVSISTAQNKHLTLVVSDIPGSSEDSAVVDFAMQLSGYSLKILSLSEVPDSYAIIKKSDLIWFHLSDTNGLPSFLIHEIFARKMRHLVSKGKGVLLSLEAAQLINAWKFESEILQTRYKTAKDAGYGRMLGFHACGKHPLFNALNGGAYILKPKKDIRVKVSGFFDGHIPQQGKVIATDWDYIFLRENDKIVTEYNLGKGKLIQIGGYTLFGMENINRLYLERLINNALNYLSYPFRTAKSDFWDYSAPDVNVDLKEFIPGKQSVTKSISNEFPEHPLEMRSVLSSGNYFDLAGERILLMGKDNGGIEELWVHPFMAFRDVHTFIRFDDNDTLICLSDLNPEVRFSPGRMIRLYRFGDALLTEVLSVSPKNPQALIQYEYSGTAQAYLTLAFSSNLRRMWPYPHTLNTKMDVKYDSIYRAFRISDKSNSHIAFIGSSRVPLRIAAGQNSMYTVQNDSSQKWDKQFQLKADSSSLCMMSGWLSYTLQENDHLDIILAVGLSEADEPLTQYRNAVLNPQKLSSSSRTHFDSLFATSMMITTPDDDLNKAYRWSLVATDNFYANTPGIGHSLMAGYSTTSTGWDGAQAISGRPGYAWYFGRDAQWSSFALLYSGQFEQVKEVLKTFVRFQDLNGKIYHELTTSGFAHYDASDATPLFIVLAGRYLRHTGDTAFIRSISPEILKAMDFCISTDTDNDGLIENTNVGHGWVEGGGLFGSHTSLYLASCWAECLKEMAFISSTLKDSEGSLFYDEWSVRVKDIINHKFWNEQKDVYSHGLMPDSGFHPLESLMAVIPMLFGQADTEKARKVLNDYFSNAYTTNWGSRIVSEHSPGFNPKGYHTGSVWPLFTGWTSLAGFANGFPHQSFALMEENLRLYQYWGLGFAEEVLNGAVFQPSGVCHHQCWSQTMGTQPMLEGMLGFKPDAINGNCHLSPYIPYHWDSLRIDNMRIGQTIIEASMERDRNVTHWHFRKKSGSGIDVHFTPQFPSCTEISGMYIRNNADMPECYSASDFTKLDINFVLDDEIDICFETKGGISVIPFVPKPKPGDFPGGLRILDSGFDGEFYFVDLEAPGGSAYEIEIYAPDCPRLIVENALYLSTTQDIHRLNVVFQKNDSAYEIKRIKIRYPCLEIQ